MSKHPKCPKEMFYKCENSALCHLCDGTSLYKNTEEQKSRRREIKKQADAEENKFLKTYQKEKKEGMAFEKKVEKQWNTKFNEKKIKKPKKPRLDMMDNTEKESDDAVQKSMDSESEKAFKFLFQKKEEPAARRQANSGALWHAKGDIKLKHALMECKERGTKTSKGKKQITIPKEWMDKQEKEALQEKRPYWYIPFGFKDEEDIYLIKPYDHEIELIYEIEELKKEIERLKGMSE